MNFFGALFTHSLQENADNLREFLSVVTLFSFDHIYSFAQETVNPNTVLAAGLEKDGPDRFLALKELPACSWKADTDFIIYNTV